MSRHLLLFIALVGLLVVGAAQSVHSQAGESLGKVLSPITVTAPGSLMVFYGTAERLELPFPPNSTLDVLKNGNPWVKDTVSSRYGAPIVFSVSDCSGASTNHFYPAPSPTSNATVFLGHVEAGDQIDFSINGNYSGVPVQVGSSQAWNANLGLDCFGSSSWWERMTISIAVAEDPDTTSGQKVDVTLLLEGPYNPTGDSMSAILNTAGYLESDARHHPYGSAPWNYPVMDSVNVGFFAANPKIVDWIYLEMRSGDPAAPPMTVEDRQVGLLMTNGQVVSHIDGTGPVTFDSLTAGARYVVACHRNHLCVMSDTTVTIGEGLASYDFTTALDQSYGTSPTKLVATTPDRFALFGGDRDADGQTIVTDFNGWLVDTKAVVTGYSPSDFGMDGGVTTLDFNLWLVNTKAVVSSQVP